MTHYAKGIGLCLVSLLAASAITAAGAHAEATFIGSEGGTHVHTEFEATGKGSKTKLGAFEVICSHTNMKFTSLTGTENNPKVSLKYTGSKTDTSNPKCELKEIVIVDVNTGGCFFIFENPSQIGSGEYTGTVGITCEEEGAMTVNVTKQESEETKCTFEIPEQSGIGHIIYRNGTSEEHSVIELETTLSGIEYKSEGGLLNCGVANGTHTNGSIEDLEGAGLTMVGKNTEEEAIDVEVTGE